jgi:hypothetical protein
MENRNKTVTGKHKRKQIHPKTPPQSFKKFRLITGAAAIHEYQCSEKKVVDADGDTQETPVFIVDSKRVESPDLLVETQLCPVCENIKPLKRFTHIGNKTVVNYCSIKNICNACISRWKQSEKLKT